MRLLVGITLGRSITLILIERGLIPSFQIQRQTNRKKHSRVEMGSRIEHSNKWRFFTI